MEPTKEQVKEFCEWCGLEFYENDNRFWARTLSGGATELKLGLTELFEYAVPFLIEELADSMARKGAVDLDFCRLYIMTKWLRGWNDCPEDPALALFWCIYSLITSDVV